MRATRARLGIAATLVGVVALGCIIPVGWFCRSQRATDGTLSPAVTNEATATRLAGDDRPALTAITPARPREGAPEPPGVPWRDHQRPVNAEEAANLQSAISWQKRLFTRHVARREASAGGASEPTMALILVRADLEQALATEHEVEAGRAWIVDENRPATAPHLTVQPDEFPVLLDLGDRRARVFLSRGRYPQFWQAHEERLRVQRMEREGSGSSPSAGNTAMTTRAGVPTEQPQEQGR